MKIVADADLYRITELFGDLGKLTLVPGRELSHADLAGADALLIRSVTNVNKELLSNSSLQFVGTATSGTDHVDIKLLQERGIHFCDAKGTNANAVVDYCFAALGELGYLQAQVFNELSIGVVGYGFIGKSLAHKLAYLGANVKICDPPVQDLQHEPTDFSDLEELTHCDIVTVHTPLTIDGKYPTRKLIDSNFLSSMKKNALLINTCRGGVVDEQAVLKKKIQHEEFKLVFDVWENEPAVSIDLVAKATIATPHIAGYSQESKYEAVNCLRKVFIDYFNLENDKICQTENAFPASGSFTATASSLVPLLQCNFSIAKQSAEFKRAVARGSTEDYFDQARKQLLDRREYKSFSASQALFGGFEGEVLNQLGVAINPVH
ncbi:MAG: 4-phosphoerythronate dehydrogenase [Gammaproteobacteria bacterium]|nr:4-phosphoerythronate dehydrogenase [Gammaproteobacteria bacterium]MDD9895312.1 4-phosphoerythronate dehydrogenase [Gammaproteobacteria bacterium]MDD9960229.1 4-phosphoerythronate dehydrogenase [Gammaproteobacteria bacterium]